MTERSNPSPMMYRELLEQPAVLKRLLKAHLPIDGALPLLHAEAEMALSTAGQVAFAACGSSYHAALLGAMALRSWAAVPAAAHVASECVAETTRFAGTTHLVSVSQSGATHDTLDAMAVALNLRIPCLTVVNTVPSSMQAQAAWTVQTWAGAEEAVPSTKGFTTQLVALLLLAIAVAGRRGVARATLNAVCSSLRELPNTVQFALQSERHVTGLAVQVARAKSVVFLGSGSAYPIAMEGALKIKEAAVMAAQAYPTLEFRHGPMALLDADTPVVWLQDDAVVDEAHAALAQRIKACGAPLHVIAGARAPRLERIADTYVDVPATAGLATAAALVVPLQLLAYHAAHARGLDMDKPRHLVKSVTR